MPIPPKYTFSLGGKILATSPDKKLIDGEAIDYSEYTGKVVLRDALISLGLEVPVLPEPIQDSRVFLATREWNNDFRVGDILKPEALMALESDGQINFPGSGQGYFAFYQDEAQAEWEKIINNVGTGFEFDILNDRTFAPIEIREGYRVYKSRVKYRFFGTVYGWRPIITPNTGGVPDAPTSTTDPAVPDPDPRPADRVYARAHTQPNTYYSVEFDSGYPQADGTILLPDDITMGREGDGSIVIPEWDSGGRYVTFYQKTDQAQWTRLTSPSHDNGANLIPLLRIAGPPQNNAFRAYYGLGDANLLDASASGATFTFSA